MKIEDFIKHDPRCLAGKYSTMGRCSCGAQTALNELSALREESSLVRKQNRSNEKDRETITISFVGTKKFKQFLVDNIHELLSREDVFEEVGKPDCGFTFESTIEPSEG